VYSTVAILPVLQRFGDAHDFWLCNNNYEGEYCLKTEIIAAIRVNRLFY